MAQQIAKAPLDPYGFEQFWYQQPQPANEVRAPPVLPYWLGLGMASSATTRFAEDLALPGRGFLLFLTRDVRAVRGPRRPCW